MFSLLGTCYRPVLVGSDRIDSSRSSLPAAPVKSQAPQVRSGTPPPAPTVERSEVQQIVKDMRSLSDAIQVTNLEIDGKPMSMVEARQRLSDIEGKIAAGPSVALS